MKKWAEFAYWFVAGAAIGLGLTLIVSIGVPLMLLGGALTIYGAYKRNTSSLWVACVGLGAVPAALLLYVYFTATSCSAEGTEILIGPGQPSSFTCIPSPETYLYMAAVFLTITLIGIAWGVLQLRKSQAKTPLAP